MSGAVAPHIRALAEFAAGTGLADIPEAVRERGRWILADCVGCIVAGNRSDEMQRLAAMEARRPGAGEASVLGTGLKLRRELAAQLNGAAGTWLDLDEGNLHTKGHAGIQIVPSLLAEAEALGMPGDAVLKALVLAYEVGCRIYGATQARLAVHPHGTYGPLAAAVALGILRRLDAAAMAGVIVLAAGLGVPASRRTLNDGATLRNAFTGATGRAAFHALDLAEAGFTGERDPLASVFGEIYGTAFDAASCVAGLGREWMILRNYFKLHPSARYAHSGIDLVDEVLARNAGLGPDAIERIELRSYFMAATMGSPEVATPFGTRFSVPFAMAARLYGCALEEGFGRDEVHELARRITVVEDAASSAAYPGRQPSALRVDLRGGGSLTARAEFIRGEAELPHGDAELAAKFLALTTPSWGGAAEAALSALRGIDGVPDFSAVLVGCAPS